MPPIHALCPTANADPSRERAELISTSAPGVYLQSASFRRLTLGIEHGFAALLGRAPDLTVRGGAVMAKADLERSGYIDRFPQLVASVTPHLPHGPADDAQAVMTPAACLNLYPLVAARGPIGPAGFTLGVTAPCHRTEATYGPTRLRSFTMSELVFFGRPSQVRAFLEGLRGAADAWLRGLGVTPLERVANDPFYGRGAEVMARHQRALQGKVEITLPIAEFPEVACLSFNLHAEFFSQRWEIVLAEGGWAQSACVGVGLERLAAALIDRHGDELETWPPPVQQALFGSPS